MTHGGEHNLDNEIRQLEARLERAGVDSSEIAVIISAVRQTGDIDSPLVASLITSATSFLAQKEREDAAGGADQLKAIEAATGRSFTVEALEDMEPTVTGFVNEFGKEGLTGRIERFISSGEEAEGLSRGAFSTIAGGTFVDPDPTGAGPGGVSELPAGFGVQRTNVGETPDGRQIEVAGDGTTWVGGVIVTGAERDRALSSVRDRGGEEDERVRREWIGNNDAGQRVETNDFGDVWLDGIQVPTGSQAANNALNQAVDNGRPDGVGAGAGAAVRLQSLGTDTEGFALIFNPATGAVTRGPQVGFAQIDPRETAEEAARRFNEQQQLREGEFVRDVLSGGRNFLTAALLTRGGQMREGQATQADIIRGGIGVSSLADAVGFGQPGAGGGVPTTTTTPATTAATGLADAGAIAAAGGATALGPLAGGTSGLATDAQISPDGFTGEPLDDLAGFARAVAPPAVKSVLAGEEVGFLSTPGATPLASPTTLANLTRGERGALGTTLEVTEQRTLEEFEQESQQRFRPGGFRQAVRA